MVEVVLQRLGRHVAVDNGYSRVWRKGSAWERVKGQIDRIGRFYLGRDIGESEIERNEGRRPVFLA